MSRAALLALSLIAATPVATRVASAAPQPGSPPSPTAAVPSPAAAAAAATPDPDRDPDGDDLPAIRPDPRAVAEAREANFEPESVREGWAVGAAIGPSMQVGFGIDKSSGAGGGYDVRLGTVASPRWVWLIEAAGTVYRERDRITGEARNNNSALFTLGGQFYLREAIWLRAGLGFASFTRRAVTSTMIDSRFYGGGAIAAGGLDLLRRGSFALSSEVLFAAARYRDGTVVGGTLQMGVSWY